MKKVLLIATTRLTMDGLTEILLRVARIAAREYLVGFALGEGCSADIQPQLEAIGSVYQLPSRKKKLPCYMAALAALVRSRKKAMKLCTSTATVPRWHLTCWLYGLAARQCALRIVITARTSLPLSKRLLADC